MLVHGEAKQPLATYRFARNRECFFLAARWILWREPPSSLTSKVLLLLSPFPSPFPAPSLSPEDALLASSAALVTMSEISFVDNDDNFSSGPRSMSCATLIAEELNSCSGSAGECALLWSPITWPTFFARLTSDGSNGRTGMSALLPPALLQRLLLLRPGLVSRAIGGGTIENSGSGGKVVGGSQRFRGMG